MIDDAYTRPCNSKINEHSASEWLSQFSNNSKDDNQKGGNYAGRGGGGAQGNRG